MKVAIVGGGLTGMALAYELSTQGSEVALFEQSDRLGGLTTHQDFGPFCWDRFYHVILPSDRELIRFCDDLGLADRLRWARTLTGLYIDEEFFSLSSNREFLRFPKLSWTDKARLAATILYCSRLSDWQRLEKIPVADWLIKHCGQRTFEILWRPLLLAKLGEHYQRVSAVFIWSYIKRMFSARDSAAKHEHLGYLEGGYKTLFEAIERRVTAAGGVLRAGTAVERISALPDGGLRLRYAGVEARFDKVIFTGPGDVLNKLADPGLADIDNKHNNSDPVEYLGVICMALVTRQPLQPYYVLNIADSRVPFTGMIGMSNLVSTDQTAGLHLSYLPIYVHADDPMLRCSDAELQPLFLDGVRRLLPEFNPADVVSASLARAARVQPLQVLNYSQRVPKITTHHPDLFVLNTAQFVNNTLNNNEVIKQVREFLTSRRGQFLPPNGIHYGPELPGSAPG